MVVWLIHLCRGATDRTLSGLAAVSPRSMRVTILLHTLRCLLIPAQLATVRWFGVGSGLISARGRSRALVLLYTVVVVVVVGGRVPAHRSVVTSLRSVVVVASSTVLGDPPLQLDETRGSSLSMRVSRTGSYRDFLSFIARRPSSASPRSRSRTPPSPAAQLNRDLSQLYARITLL